MNQTNPLLHKIKVIIGLGNPGLNYYKTRHNIGFRVVDLLADRCGGTWQKRGNAEIAKIEMHDQPVVLIKPQTFMNSSGEVIAALQRDGVKPENILVVHDEMEHPFGKVTTRLGGSHRGHNGLRSIIERCGAEFGRLRVGIGRPERKEDVPEYVLKPFAEGENKVEEVIEKAVEMITDLF